MVDYFTQPMEYTMYYTLVWEFQIDPTAFSPPHQAIAAVARKVKWGTEVQKIQYTVFVTGSRYCPAAVEEKT